MSLRSARWIACALVVSFSLLGCATGSEPEDERQDDLGTLDDALKDYNSLTTNSLTTNSLTTNSLTTNSLTTNSLTTNSLLQKALGDPRSREVLGYIVGCALPDGSDVEFTADGETYRYPGALGLAPEWATDLCDETCQEMVSSCVIARVNFLGQRVELSLRGPPLSSNSSERSQFPNVEAVYMGNIFVEPKIYQACLPSGRTSIPRVCGPSLAGCFLQSVQKCECWHTPSTFRPYYDGCAFPGFSWLKSPLTVYLQ